jgi:hypothetical protein
VRASIANVVNLITERQKTPWIAIFSAFAVVLSMSGLIGSLALSPINSDLLYLKNNLVSRTEHETREREANAAKKESAVFMDARFNEIQRQVGVLDRLTNELQKEKVPSADFYAQHTDLKALVAEIRGRVDRLENLRLRPSGASP